MLLLVCGTLAHYDAVLRGGVRERVRETPVGWVKGTQSTGFLSTGVSPWDTRSVWLPYAICIAVLIPVAPWETFLIFPTNDKIEAMGKELERTKKTDFGDQRDQELQEAMISWQRFHVGRVVMPALGFGIMVLSGVDGRFGG